MRSIVYEGNTYEEIDYEVQKMLKMANIFTFQFYINDRLWVSSNATMDKFHIEKFYHVTNLDKLPPIFYAGDLPKIRKLYAEIMLGKSVVYNEVRSYDGEAYYKITLISSKYDEDGKLWMIYGSWFGGIYMMELDPRYVDVIIKRWEDYTGNKSIKLE